MAENNDLFLLAAERMRSNAGLSLNNEQKLTIYGYYKQVSLTLSLNETSSLAPQATEGPCNVSKPGYFDFTGRAKWYYNLSVLLKSVILVFCLLH